MKKSMKALIEKLEEKQDGSLKGGFASIKGGFRQFSGSLFNSNIGPCSNTGDCGKATNIGSCTNSGSC